MRVENKTANTGNAPMEIVGNAIREGFVLSSVFITSYDGLYYISELALSIFALADKIIEHAPKSLHRTLEILQGHPALHNSINLFKSYTELTCVLDIVNRGREWMSQDENGKYIWERGYPTLAYYISLTISDITNHLYLIDKLKFIKLGALAGPVNIIYGAATISQQVFDIWTSFYELRTAIYKSEESKVRYLQWQLRKHSTSNEIRQLIQSKVEKWKAKADLNETDRNVTKRNYWWKLSHVKDDNELHVFVSSMADRSEVTQKNHSIKVLTTYCSLVCTISYLALLILSAFSALVVLQELVVAVAILYVVVNAMYVGNFIVEHYFKDKEVPKPFEPTRYFI